MPLPVACSFVATDSVSGQLSIVVQCTQTPCSATEETTRSESEAPTLPPTALHQRLHRADSLKLEACQLKSQSSMDKALS